MPCTYVEAEMPWLKVRREGAFFLKLLLGVYALVGRCYALMNVRMKIQGLDMNFFDVILLHIQNFFPSHFLP